MEDIKRDLEKIFREASTSDELFDAFERSLNYKIKDIQIYKILLGNILLSTDEIKLFTEKLCSEFPEYSSELYMWTANILESNPKTDNLDSAFQYYNKAISIKPADHQPYCSILKMYNNDLDYPPRKQIELLFEKGMNEVKLRSKLCLAIADFYDRTNEPSLKKKFQRLASSFSKKENLS
jgi:hypothetical protein